MLPQARQTLHPSFCASSTSSLRPGAAKDHVNHCFPSVPLAAATSAAELSAESLKSAWGDLTRLERSDGPALPAIDSIFPVSSLSRPIGSPAAKTSDATFVSKGNTQATRGRRANRLASHARSICCHCTYDKTNIKTIAFWTTSDRYRERQLWLHFRNSVKTVARDQDVSHSLPAATSWQAVGKSFGAQERLDRSIERGSGLASICSSTNAERNRAALVAVQGDVCFWTKPEGLRH